MPSVVDQSFDIRGRYFHHLEKSLPPILAAVAAIADSIEFYPVKTISETLALFSSSSERLISTCDLPRLIEPALAGFRRWLILLLDHPTIGVTLSPSFKRQCTTDDFDERKRWLVDASRAYVSEGIVAKESIAKACQPLLRGLRNPHILVPVCDEVVSGILEKHAKTGKQFRVSLVQPLHLGLDSEIAGHVSLKKAHNGLVSLLKPYDIPVEEIPPQGVASALSQRNTILLTASSLLYGTGAMLAPLGSRQAAILAYAAKVPVYVAAEFFKEVEDTPIDRRASSDEIVSQASMDFTPSQYITSFIMECGFASPAQVTEHVIKKWL